MNAFFTLIRKLAQIDSFHEGAEETLKWLTSSIESTLGSTKEQNSLVISRSMLHARSDTTYKSLTIFPPKNELESKFLLKPSTTAWHLIEEYRRPVTINVSMNQASIQGESAVINLPIVNLDRNELNTTMKSLAARSTTHLLVVPIFAANRTLEGMASFEFISKSLAENINLEFLLTTVEPALTAITPLLFSLNIDNNLIGQIDVLPVESQWARNNHRLLEVLAKQMQPLLLQGPTGVGKTFLAKWIHYHSLQASGEFVEARLNQVPEESALPHLFGWKKGAYTGATAGNSGWANRSENGTLFLDEIDTLSLSQQFGLLEFLDSGRFTTMGSSREKKLENVRFVFATNANLVQLVERGSFREDLYHRINTLAVELPCLRDRRDEIPSWLDHFSEEFKKNIDEVSNIRFDENFVNHICTLELPGNLRELRKIVFNTCTVALANNTLSSGLLSVGLQPRKDSQIESKIHTTPELFGSLYSTSKKIIEEAVESNQPIHSTYIESKGILHDALWIAAIEALGDTMVGRPQGRVAVAKLLRKTAAVKNNNYGAELKRVCRRVADFCIEQNETIPLPVEQILHIYSPEPKQNT